VTKRGPKRSAAAKDEGATYRGGPSRSWLKVKVRHEGVFLIGGVGLGERLRGLLVGERDGELLLFRGTVEFGVSSALLAELAGSPLARPTSPFTDLPRCRGVTWLEPTIGVEVQYNEMTGGRLRAPVLRGFNRRRDLRGRPTRQCEQRHGPVVPRCRARNAGLVPHHSQIPASSTSDVRMSARMAISTSHARRPVLATRHGMQNGANASNASMTPMGSSSEAPRIGCRDAMPPP